MKPVDVAIIGGGPAGATAGALLRKYMPSLSVVILEKERFPREHIGESQLPLISVILDEMGAWEKVEAADFPIKLGATYTWGRDPAPWHFNFVPPEQFQNKARPARFEGQRRYTAFQVDRAIYDDILLRHAASTGCEVRQEMMVSEVLREGDRVTGLRVRPAPSDPISSDGGRSSQGTEIGGSEDTVTARYYIDCSGNVGIVRRAMGVEIDSLDRLKNVSFWDYWESDDWNDTAAHGYTRIQIRSLPYGWIWFIPISSTRVSIGLVCHTDHYKKHGDSPTEIYRKALQDEKFIATQVAKATPTGQTRSTRDWSYLAERLYGENWFLTGEASGFADPILSAGMTLSHASARDAAYTIMELERGKHERKWLLERFNEKNREAINNHIRFAIYWYAANGIQSDLEEHCRTLAADAGLRLNAKDAFRWISQGAFSTELLGNPSIGFFDITSIHDLANRFAERGRTHSWLVHGHSVFQLNVHNATQGFVGDLKDGRIIQVPCLFKGKNKLPLYEFFGLAVDVLRQTSDAQTFMDLARNAASMIFPAEHVSFAMTRIVEALEAMALEGWVICRHDKRRPALLMSPQAETIVPA
jgi:flavin-dependent dehydrogenase